MTQNVSLGVRTRTRSTSRPKLDQRPPHSPLKSRRRKPSVPEGVRTRVHFSTSPFLESPPTIAFVSQAHQPISYLRPVPTTLQNPMALSKTRRMQCVFQALAPKVLAFSVLAAYMYLTYLAVHSTRLMEPTSPPPPYSLVDQFQTAAHMKWMSISTRLQELLAFV